MFYIVSGHGGRPNGFIRNAQGQEVLDTMVVPNGFAVHFYVADNAVLQNNVALQIYRDLTTTGVASVAPVHIYAAGDAIQKYYCWEMEDQYQSYSQIICVTPQAPAAAVRQAASAASQPAVNNSPPQLQITSLSGFRQHSPKTLASIFADFAAAPAVIHWLGCTGAPQGKHVKFT